jgi:predicted permease
MSIAVLFKLLVVFAMVALGWAAGRTRLLGPGDAARVLGNAAFFLFVPALLVRTTVRIDLSAMPWSTLAAFFVPAVAFMLLVYAVQRRPFAGAENAAVPSVRAIAASFGNTVQLGIPFVTALFGEAGLSVHLAIVSLHALTLLTIVTALVELDLARVHARSNGVQQPLGATLLVTVRNTVLHPVVLTVLVGLAVNLTGATLPPLLDETLALLAQAVVPLCLVAIGMSLAHYGLAGAWQGALWICVAKLVLLPALVLVAGHWGAGLTGVPLAAIVVCAALPVGVNPLLFAQRYAALEGEVTTAIVLSTLGFVFAAPLWLLVLGWVG